MYVHVYCSLLVSVYSSITCVYCMSAPSLHRQCTNSLITCILEHVPEATYQAPTSAIVGVRIMKTNMHSQDSQPPLLENNIKLFKCAVFKTSRLQHLFDAQFQPNLACEYPNSCTYNAHALTVHTKTHTEARVEGLCTYIFCGRLQLKCYIYCMLVYRADQLLSLAGSWQEKLVQLND